MTILVAIQSPARYSLRLLIAAVPSLTLRPLQSAINSAFSGDGSVTAGVTDGNFSGVMDWLTHPVVVGNNR